MATIQVTKDGFEKLITDNEIVILDFWASWCGPCRQFAPIFEKAAEKHTDVAFGKINTEEEQELSAGFGIRSIPTLMIFREKILLFQQAGSLPESALEEILSKVKALDMNQIRAEIAAEAAKDQAPQL